MPLARTLPTTFLYLAVSFCCFPGHEINVLWCQENRIQFVSCNDRAAGGRPPRSWQRGTALACAALHSCVPSSLKKNVHIDQSVRTDLMGQQVFRYSDDAGLTQGACAALHHPESQTKSIDSHNEWNGTVSKKHSPVPLVVQSNRFFLLGSGKGNHGQRGYPYAVCEAARTLGTLIFSSNSCC